jgi:peptidyl-prolyl cis-trans isomerase SurA
MKEDKLKVIIAAWIFSLCAGPVFSQELIESVAAIVGNEVVYLSDVENAILQQRSYGNRMPAEDLRCKIFEDLLVTKLFLDQARIDSIEVAESNVDGELNMRMNDAIRQAGSEDALEKYFKKSMIEIRRDIRNSLLEQEVVREVQSKIGEKISITPGEVKRYFSKLAKDSLPVVPAKVELKVIQLDPPASEENKIDARQRLLDLRSEILAGKSFQLLAIMYSEDTESAKNGGEIGFLTRDELQKEYADAAFGLNKNTVSRIVETKFGFHIIQLIDRRGEMVNTRHILIRPKVKPDEARQAMEKLDSIADLIRKDSITFEKGALIHSSHKDSRINGGILVKNDPNARITWFTLDELDKETYVQVRDLKVGEISNPFRTTDEDGNVVFRIVKLVKEMPAHRANLKDDYQMLDNAALMEKRSKTYADWINKKIGITYIKISEEFKSCNLSNPAWMK